jgi:hypothetical protein
MQELWLSFSDEPSVSRHRNPESDDRPEDHSELFKAGNELSEDESIVTFIERPKDESDS